MWSFLRRTQRGSYPSTGGRVAVYLDESAVAIDARLEVVGVVTSHLGTDEVDVVAFQSPLEIRQNVDMTALPTIVFDDLEAEEGRIRGILSGLSEREWETPSLAAGWTVCDVPMNAPRLSELRMSS